MKNSIYLLLFITVLLGSYSCSHPEHRKYEYFIRPCEFVCNYPFSDTSKWAITCRVWGLLKYHHPNITAGKLDWDKVLLDRVDDINFSSSPELVNAELKKMLDAAGKFTFKKEDTWNTSLNMNVDLCWLDNSFIEDTLQNELRKIASLSVKHPSYYGVDFDSEKRLVAHHEKEYNIEMESSYKHRLLALFRYWNVIYYYFPHKYLMDQSWDKTLNEFIPQFIKATDKQFYQIAFLKLAASLNDGHAYSTIANYYPKECNDIIEKAEGKTIVRIDLGGLNKADIISCIGGRHIDHIRDSLSALVPASTQSNKDYRINCYVAEMIFLHETDITVIRNGGKYETHMLPVTFDTKLSSPYKKITADIGYVDLSVLTTSVIDSMFLSFSDVTSIIFDLRKNGPYNYDENLLECHLSDLKTTRLNPMTIPDLEHPGAYLWVENVHDVIPNKTECSNFKKKVVYLINENTQSSLEAKAWVARINFHATLIGRPTSGALGQVVRVSLPGNDHATFSGVALLSLDKSELQRKGIMPDIKVYPTIVSIKAGEDEILETAMKHLSN